MSVVPYYQGRPASTWVRAMSGPAQTVAANRPDGTSPASRQPAVPGPRSRAHAQNSALAAACAVAMEAWASNWFTPDRRPS